MDRKEMLREKVLLEDKIQDVVIKFQEKTGLSVDLVDIRHEHEMGGELATPWITVRTRLQ